MKEVLKYSNKTLIIKYGNYYIRFMGGQYVELPCDIKITKAEAEKIIRNPDALMDIFNAYKEQMVWSVESFIQMGLEEYLYNVENYSKEKINCMITKLNQYENIKYEMYECIMKEEFPVSGSVRICGKTAKDFSENATISVGRAYILLLESLE